MKKIQGFGFALLLFLATSMTFAQSTADFFSKSDAFFKEHVKKGRIQYKNIKNNSVDLDALLEMAKGISVNTSEATEYQSFWINAYNLGVIKGVVTNYPLKSPLDISGFFDKTTYELGGINITLNDIENKMLRAKFPKEARFHFVLVCGGLGCPPIIAEAYTPAALESQLTTQTTKALNDANFIRVKKNKVQVSQIFEWYPGDFKQDGKDLVAFINQYKSEKLPEKAKVSYYPYDWTLNEAK